MNDEAEKLIARAKSLGIADIDCHRFKGTDMVSLDTLKLACDLTEKYGPEVNRRKMEILREQENNS